MADTLYDPDRHLTPQTLLAMEMEQLTFQEKAEVLAHLEVCQDCMEQFLISLTDDILIDPPEGMEERIAEEIHAVQKKQKDGRILVIKFTKLAVAVCLTMMLTMGGVFERLIQAPRMMPERQTGSEHHLREEEILSFKERQKTMREEDRKNVIGDFFSSFDRGFSDFARSFNNAGLLDEIGVGKNERK